MREKYVVRPGVLQDKPGPSIAAEFGVRYPETAGLPFRGQLGGHHLAALGPGGWCTSTCKPSRELRADLFVSAVRPLAEVFYKDDVGSARTFSALVGLIWQVREDLPFDVAVREASVNGRAVNELRAGSPLAFPLDRSTQSKR